MVHQDATGSGLAKPRRVVDMDPVLRMGMGTSPARYSAPAPGTARDLEMRRRGTLGKQRSSLAATA
jgi:hypothetical protein